MTSPDTAPDPAAYYADVTRQYQLYAGAAQGWHYGIWEPDVQTEAQALHRGNEVLVRGLALGAESRVLDVGCGSGGFASWVARSYGCRATGITIVPDHLELARQLASSRRVAALCTFRVMDMDRLPLPAASFDLVTNHESFCHAADKTAYLASVRRVLRPGGSWRAIAFSIVGSPLGTEQRRAHEDVCNGFHCFPLVPGEQVRALLEEAGFVDIHCEDRTADVLETARRIASRCRLPALLMQLRLNLPLFYRDARARRNREGHIRAASAYSRGLLAGHFRHWYYEARRPQAAG